MLPHKASRLLFGKAVRRPGLCAGLGGIDVMAAPVFLVMVMQVTSGLVFDYKGRVLLCGFADQLYGLGPLTGCLQVVLAVPDFVTRTPGCSSMCPAHASHHPVLNGGVSLE